jgi:hypothetical protein
LKQQDSNAAWKDLLCIEEAGLNDPQVGRLRQELVQRKIRETQLAMERGEPARAIDLAAGLREHRVQDAELDEVEEAARSWSLARELAAKGELAQASAALERLPRIRTGQFTLLDEFRQDLRRRRAELEPVLGRLHLALEQGDWREVIQLADQVLAIAPQHAEARKARSRAWKAVEPPTLPAVPAAATKSVPPSAEELPRRFLLWIDGVGGYLVCTSSRVSLGQATPDASVDVPIFADISRLHAFLNRDGEGYLLEAVRPASVNQRGVERTLLGDGDRITLGAACQLRFRQPVPLSATARLELASGHRLAVAVDGVLLMGETCILGEPGQAHVEIPGLRRPVVLLRRPDGFGVRIPGDFTVDGQKCRDRWKLGLHSTVAGDDFRFTLEPLSARLGKLR